MTGLLMPAAPAAVLRFLALRPSNCLASRQRLVDDWTVCRRRLHATYAGTRTKPALYTYRGLPALALLSVAGSGRDPLLNSLGNTICSPMWPACFYCSARPLISLGTLLLFPTLSHWVLLCCSPHLIGYYLSPHFQHNQASLGVHHSLPLFYPFHLIGY